MDNVVEYEDLIIPVYAINAYGNKAGLAHIREQFKYKKEFDLNIVEAGEQRISQSGLWGSIVRIITLAVENKDDVIIICEDDHEFTDSYSKEYLFQNIIEANEQGVNVLTGGVTGFSHIVPVTQNRYWVDFFGCTKFIIIYKSIFKQILSECFCEDDIVDIKLSELSSNKMILHPFICGQKEFSDVPPAMYSQYQQDRVVADRFDMSSKRLERIRRIYDRYVLGKPQ